MEYGAGSREQGAGSREQGAWSGVEALNARPYDPQIKVVERFFGTMGARNAEEKALNRSMLGFAVFFIGVGCGYAWHMMAVG